MVTDKRKPKSISKAVGPQISPKTTTVEAAKNDKKVKKSVRISQEAVKVTKKPTVKPERTTKEPVLKDKPEKKKLEPEVPKDARVIDVTFQDEGAAPDIKKNDACEDFDEKISYLTGKGTQHPVHELIQNLRQILINSGFNELENPFFVADTDIIKQHRVKPNLVFDRVYYLAESQRPGITLEQNDVQKIQSIIPNVNIDKLKSVFNEYKENKIENFQLYKSLMSELKLTSNQISTILDIIPGLNDCNPKPTNITLRSSMASSWFTTLAAIMDRDTLPIKVFSTGIWFKRGPKLNELKLSSHYATSLIIMDKKISVDNGKLVAQEILERLGFKNLVFKKADLSENFFVINNEIKILVEDLEIATCGMFSKEVLNKYGINVPTLYINLGLEHMVMVKKGFDDIRELMYPQFYKAWKLNDNQIAEALQFIYKPKTELGNKIASELVKICEQHGNMPSPCEYPVYSGPVAFNLKTTSPNIGSNSMSNKRLIVKVFKRDKDSKLCGPAFLNEVVVKNGDIFSVQTNGREQELCNAQHTKIRFLDAFSKLVGSTIEDKLQTTPLGQLNEIILTIIKDLEDINLQLDGGAFRYILTNNKKIDIRGPFFVKVEWKIFNSPTATSGKKKKNNI